MILWEKTKNRYFRGRFHFIPASILISYLSFFKGNNRINTYFASKIYVRNIISHLTIYNVMVWLDVSLLHSCKINIRSIFNVVVAVVVYLLILPLFLARLAKGQVSYCHHLASVFAVIVVNNYTKLFSSEITWLNRTKLGMNVPLGILLKTGYFWFVEKHGHCY